jgi:hypothetical protein
MYATMFFWEGFAMVINRILLICFITWVTAQVVKGIIHYILTKQFSWERLFGDGGMPSCHTATVAALATATGLTCGMDSPEFAISVIFALIVMHDAVGVRQETGKQAKVLNDLVDSINTMTHKDLTPEENLKEFVGHTGRQVFVGLLLGVVEAFLLNMIL